MSQYLDQYFLVEIRDKELILRFLNKYLPDRKDSSIDYPIPQYDVQPTVTLNTTEEILAYLEDNIEIEYSIYWQNIKLAPVIQNAMAFYTDDGNLILGVSVKGNCLEESEILSTYSELKDFLGAKISCITSEEPPPTNSEEFLVFAQNRYPNS